MRDAKGKFLPGHREPNAGRPKGSKNKLANSFFTDILTVWEERGLAAVREMAEMDPVLQPHDRQRDAQGYGHRHCQLRREHDPAGHYQHYCDAA